MKEYLLGKVEDLDKKIRNLSIRVDEIQEKVQKQTKLESRLLILEKAFEKFSNDGQKSKEKDCETNLNWRNHSKKQEDLKEDLLLKNENFTNVSEPRKKSNVEAVKSSLSSYKENNEKELKNAKDFENAYKEIRESVNRKKDKKERKKEGYREDPDFELFEKEFKDHNLKNEKKYSQIFNEVHTERPYLIERSKTDNNVMKDSRKTLKNTLQNEDYMGSNNYQNEKFNKPERQKTHSFYLNQEEQNSRRKTHSSIENLEKQEKRKKIDEGFSRLFFI